MAMEVHRSRFFTIRSTPAIPTLLFIVLPQGRADMDSHLGGDDIPGDHHDLLSLSPGLRYLGHMHVHLIPIKVGIVGRRD